MTSKKSLPRKRVPRDTAYLQAIRDGRVPRAATFEDRKKKTSKELCRKPLRR